jgi:hypothetical protein
MIVKGEMFGVELVGEEGRREGNREKKIINRERKIYNI